MSDLMANALEQELQTYEKNKAALLGVARDKHVLIKGEKILGTFDTQNDAITIGYRDLGNVPFLTKKIEEVERPAAFTRGRLRV